MARLSNKLTTDQVDKVYSILDRFDFEKVRAYMVIKDWKVDGKVPDVKELRSQAKSLLESVASDRYESYKYNPNYGLFAHLDVNTDSFKLLFYIENKNNIEL